MSENPVKITKSPDMSTFYRIVVTANKYIATGMKVKSTKSLINYKKKKTQKFESIAVRVEK